MYFSRVQLNPQRRKTREVLANPQKLHALVAASLPPEMEASREGRLLWRVDTDAHDVRLYITSPFEPGLEHIVEQTGWSASPGQTTDYGRFLNQLTRGQSYRFRATLNPVKQQRIPNSRGKLLPFCREEEQIEWLCSRSSKWGFSLPTVPPPADATINGASEAGMIPGARVLRSSNRTFTKSRGTDRHHVTQRQVTFIGSLTVEDPALLRHALSQGMGRGKAYGCGLMTLARDA